MSKKKRDELGEYAKNIKQGIYHMLRITTELLDNHAYVDSYGGESGLIDDLEVKEFAFFGGSPPLTAMLRAYRHNPDIKIWREYHFNIRAMIDLAAPAREGEEKVRINWKAQALALQETVEEQKRVIEELRASNDELRQSVYELTTEAAKQAWRVEVLESLRK